MRTPQPLFRFIIDDVCYDLHLLGCLDTGQRPRTRPFCYHASRINLHYEAVQNTVLVYFPIQVGVLGT
jgi:hypothetical protein